MKLPKYKCNRCGHEWIPRTEKEPLVCPHPKCKSRYWNKKRIRGIEKPLCPECLTRSKVVHLSETGYGCNKCGTEFDTATAE